MSRSQSAFLKTFNEVKWYVNFHKRSVWLVPRADDYIISIIRPTPEELPMGTAAICYDTELMEIDRVKAEK